MKTRTKKKILVATWFHCLRNCKEVIGAFHNGYKLELLTKDGGLSLAKELEVLPMYENIKVWETPSQLEYYLKTSDADAIWCHNEPDLMTELASAPEIKRDRLLLHDCHDLPTLHPGHEEDLAPQEKVAIEKSDYVFVPTPDYVDMIHKKYNENIKVEVVQSCPPEMYFPDTDLPRVNGILYCGQINVPEMDSKLPYRNVLPLFQAFTELGVASHIYHTTPNINTFRYTMAGACIYGVMRMYAAIHQYTRYDYGFVGSSMDSPEIQICMPNKLFDCMAAGIPLVALNATTAGKFIEDNGIGVSVQGIQNLREVPWGDWEFWKKCRKKVREIRYEYTAEKEIKRVFDKIGF